MACFANEIKAVASLMNEEMSLALMSAWIFLTIPTAFSIS